MSNEEAKEAISYYYRTYLTDEYKAESEEKE